MISGLIDHTPRRRPRNCFRCSYGTRRACTKIVSIMIIGMRCCAAGRTRFCGACGLRVFGGFRTSKSNRRTLNLYMHCDCCWRRARSLFMQLSDAISAAKHEAQHAQDQNLGDQHNTCWILDRKVTHNIAHVHEPLKNLCKHSRIVIGCITVLWPKAFSVEFCVLGSSFAPLTQST